MKLDPVHGVLSPAEVELFRAVTGVGDAPLEVNFDGWAKRAILSSDRVFLFPRRGHDQGLAHGASCCEMLAARGIACAPTVYGRWDAAQLPSAGPFVSFERRPGRSWILLEGEASLADWKAMLSSLATAIASWHSVGLAELPVELSGPPRFSPKPALSELLGTASVDDLVREVARLTGVVDDRSASVWRDTLEEVRAFNPVLVHGDVCENQLLVDEKLQVGTVLDWDTAGVGHRLHDFDFGEWGYGIYHWEAEFPKLRRAMWESYLAAIGPGHGLASWPMVHLVFVLSDLLHFGRAEQRGALDAWGAKRLASLPRSLRRATEDAGR